MGSFRWLIIAAGAILVLSYNACSEVEFAQPEGIFAAGGPGSPGVPVDPGSIPECEGVDIGNFRGACVVFQDRFERDQIVHQGDFKWNSIIMDNG